ncbi:hypothetical protein J4401_03970 [Candidatus Woesearchaeota archaeon]|nr:hypothetical protein [Candidatus Woesearchaeota archaeon]
MSMLEKYRESVEEFKRVDHLYHVSLKYTRTVDIIRSAIERIISTYENSVECFIEFLKEEKLAPTVPDNPVGKAMIVLENIKSKQVETSMNLYLKLRRIMREPYGKREEFRRHVTMTTELDGEKLEIDIDKIKEYYDITTEFLSFLKKSIEPYVDSEEE